MAKDAILGLLRDIAEAQSIDNAWGLASGYFASIGFRRMMYGFTRFRHQRTIGDPDDALFLTTFEGDYTQRYFQGGFYARAPAFRWAERNSGACTWTWVIEAFEADRLPPEEMEAVRFNATMGVLAGITISFPEVSARAKIKQMTVFIAKTKLLRMTKKTLRLLFISVAFFQRTYSQTDIDGLMMQKNFFCIGPTAGYSVWKNYWEGTLKRENLNLGKVSATNFMVMGNYGITSRLNVLFGLPYIKTKASAGQMAGQKGL